MLNTRDIVAFINGDNLFCVYVSWNLQYTNGSDVTSLLLSPVGPAALRGLEISLLEAAFCLGLGWPKAQRDQKQILAQSFTGGHDVGAEWAWNGAKPAAGLPALGQAN